ncbi:MAG: hypothetical protein J6O55_07250 [Lachnospiraceae bacterium]|nr:hypothetical protein [Lachnospiraceae bacterium]
MERNSSFLRREFNKALLPVMGSVLGGTINTLIDSAFVSRRLDASALASVSLNMPIFLMLCTVGSLYGAGASVSATHALGRNAPEEASKIYHSGLFMALLSSAFFMFLGIAFSDKIATLLCHDPYLYPMVKDYCMVTLIGSLPYILIYFPVYFLQLAGIDMYISLTMGIMVISDMILDWLFLYVLNWGVAGAALASVLSMLLACAYGFYYLQDKRRGFNFELKKLRPRMVHAIILFGSSSALGSLQDAAKLLILNWILYRSGAAAALATWAVINSLIEVSLTITTGIPRTATPLLGIYVGGQDNDGTRLLIREEARTGVMLSLIFGLLIILLNQPIALFFKLNRPLIFIPVVCLAVAIPFETLISILGSYYNTSGHVLLSNFTMFLRTFAMPLGFALILPLFKLPIWLFMPVSMICTLATVYITAKIIIRKSKKTKLPLNSILLLDDSLERNNKVMSFSIISSDEYICKASEDISEFCIENQMERKKATRMALALEEVMTVMVRKSLRSQNAPVDIRVYVLEKSMGLNIMCFGNYYNPFEEAAEDPDNEANMGVQMINRIAKNCHYLYTLGFNILAVDL